MLDAFAYPVSALMKLWHDLLSVLISPDSGLVWVSSIVLLVCSVRLILLRPAWKQLYSARRTAVLQPRMRELKRRHGTDQQAYLLAVRELQRSEGITMASGLLPTLVQLPAFLGLYHLLAAFTATGTSGGNGLFGPAQVLSFAHATLLGVPLSAAVRTPAAALAALQSGLTTGHVLAVMLPLLLVAATATFVNLWWSQRQQPPTDGQEPMTATVRLFTRSLVWLSPVSLLVGGIVYPLPLAMAVYWAVNGTWTTVQHRLMSRRLDRLLPLTT